MCLCFGKSCLSGDEKTSKSSSTSDNSDLTNSHAEVHYAAEGDGQISCAQIGYGATDDIELTTFLVTQPSEEGDTPSVEEVAPGSVEVDALQPLIQITYTNSEASNDSKPEVLESPTPEIQSLEFNDVGLSVCNFASLPLLSKSHSASFPSSNNSKRLLSAVSSNSLDTADLAKKKKKKLRLKRFRMKKKKSPLDQGGISDPSSVDSKEYDESVSPRSCSTASIDTAEGSVEAKKKPKTLKKLLFSKKKTSVTAYTKYTSSSLVASLDGLSDDNVCKE